MAEDKTQETQTESEELLEEEQLEEEVSPDQAVIEAARQFAGQPPRAVAAALLTHAHPVYQSIFSAGITTGQKQEEAKLTKADEAIKTLKKDLKERETRIASLSAESPEKERTILDQAARIADLEKQIEDTKAQHTQERVNGRKEGIFEKLQAALGQFLREDIASYKAKDEKIRARFQFNEDASTHRVLQKDKAIPMPIPSGKEGWEVLAEELVREAHPGDRRPQMERGGGQYNNISLAPGGVSAEEAAERKRQQHSYTM